MIKLRVNILSRRLTVSSITHRLHFVFSTSRQFIELQSLHLCFPLAILAVLGVRYPFAATESVSAAPSSTERVFLPFSSRSVQFSDNVTPSESDSSIDRRGGDINENCFSDIKSKMKNSNESENVGNKKRAIAAGQVYAAAHPADTLGLWKLAVLGSLGGADLVLLYYCLPSFSFVALYSILPHKVSRTKDHNKRTSSISSNNLTALTHLTHPSHLRSCGSCSLPCPSY